MKKLISFICAITLICSVASTSVLAADSTKANASTAETEVSTENVSERVTKNNTKKTNSKEVDAETGYTTKTAEELLLEITNDTDIKTGSIFVSEEVMNDIRKYVSETKPSLNSTKKWGLSFSDSDFLWELNSEFALHVNDERKFELISSDYFTTSEVTDSYFSTADVSGYFEKQVCWGAFTVVSEENGFSVWKFGEKQELSEELVNSMEDFSYPTFDGWHSGAKRVFMHSGTDFRVWDLEEEQLIKVCEDYSEVDYDTFCNSFYYINTAGNVVSVNMLTLESEVVSKKLAKGFTGSDSIRGLTFAGDEFNLPGYVDWDGEFVEW